MEQVIFQQNRALFARSRELNHRAGREIFPVPTRTQLAEMLMLCLGGATCLAQISDKEVLRLPALDDVLVAQVLEKSPDTIDVIGRRVAVDYYQPLQPRVRLDFLGSQSSDWLKLPDEGFCLSDDRELSIISTIEGAQSHIHATSSEFKAKAKELLNRRLWERVSKPELSVSADEELPAIVQIEYGRCVLTGAPLIAFGTTKYDPYFGLLNSYWTRDRDEAETAHALACEKLPEVRAKVRRESLGRLIGGLYNAHYYKLPEQLLARMHRLQYTSLGSVAEMEAVIAEVEALVAPKVQVKEQKQESVLPQNAPAKTSGAIDAHAFEALVNRFKR